IFTSDDLTTQRVQVVIHDDDHQGIHTSSDSIVLPEGTATIVGVRLTAKPLDIVTVTAKTAAPTEVVSPSWTFDPGTWDQPQMMPVLSNKDANNVSEDTVIVLSSPGMPDHNVLVHNVDADP